MLVPAAVEDLHEPDVALDQTAGQQRDTARRSPACARRARTGRGCACGSLEMSASSGTEVCIRKAISYWAIRAWVSGSANWRYSCWLSRLSASSDRRRVAASTPVGIREVQHRVAVGPQRHALMPAGQIARAPEPVVDRLRLLAAGPGRRHHHEGGQVAVHRPQAVAQPRAQAGAARELVPRADISDRRVVVDRLGPDRLDQRDVVDDPGRPGQELADPRAGLAVPGELVLRRRHREPRLAAGHRGQPLAHADRVRQVLVEHGLHPGLVVPEVHLRRAAVHEQVDGPLRPGREVRQPRQPAGSPPAAARASVRSASAAEGPARPVGQQAGQRGGPQAHARAAEEMPPRHHVDLLANRVHVRGSLGRLSGQMPCQRISRVGATHRGPSLAIPDRVAPTAHSG